MLNQSVSDQQLSEIAFLLSALAAEGVTTGISALRDADAVLTEFIELALRSSLTLGICELALFLRMKRTDETLLARCDALLKSKACTELTARAAAQGRASKLAEYLGMAESDDNGD